MLAIIGLYLGIAFAALFTMAVLIGLGIACRTLWVSYHAELVKPEIVAPAGLVSVTPPVNKQLCYFTDITPPWRAEPGVNEGSELSSDDGKFTPKSQV